MEVIVKRTEKRAEFGGFARLPRSVLRRYKSWEKKCRE
jgi:hypothetical protein